MQATTPEPVTAATLQLFLGGPVIHNDPVLKELLVEADNFDNATLIIFDFFNQTTIHAGKELTALCGYTVAAAVAGGAEFVIRITNPADMPYLMLLQAGHVKEAKAHGFNPASFRFHDYYWTMIGREGTKVPVLSTGIVLTYTAQNDLGVGVGFHIRNDSDCDATSIGCKELLCRIKQRHNEVYRHPERGNISTIYPLHHINPTTDLITQRERQVLGLLAQGHSTTVISETLHIAANTVESHRKKLLQKFHAKNTAQLILKASKVFSLS